jgi:hypothetical protein
MTGRAVVVVGLAILAPSCNQVFDLDKTRPAPDPGGDGGMMGIDLDLDDIPDDQDPCVAAATDFTQDEDQDEIINGEDPCPLDDTTQTPVDGDGDTIPNTCDPFPASGGDRKRCTMTFNNPDLNMRLWHESDALAEWETGAGVLHTAGAQGVANLVSTIRIDGSAQPSYDVQMTANANGGGFHFVRVWARAADPATRDDVGCELSGDAGSVRIAVVLGDGRDVGTPTTVFAPFPSGIDLRVQMSAGPSSLVPNMRCSFAWQSVRHTVTAPQALPAGQVGFGVDNAQLSVTGLVVYDRDTVQPYP